jgi:hypothetical protein
VRRAVGGDAKPGGFLAYLASKRDDIALATATFLSSQGPTTGPAFKKRFTHLTGFVKNGRYPRGPEVVFWEADAKLVRAGTKTPITKW